MGERIDATGAPVGRGVAILLAALVAVIGLVGLAGCVDEAPASVLDPAARTVDIVDLPPPDLDGTVPLESTLATRRSTRDFAADDLGLDTIGQLLWAGQGVTSTAGYRTAPSAGALYPLELHAVTSDGVLHYLPDGHRVERRAVAITPADLGGAAFDQSFVGTAPLVLVVAGVPSRTAAKYGDLATSFVDREAGHAVQNVLLQATALDLAAVPVGGFDPADVARLLALPPGHEVVYVVPIGRPG